MGVEVDPYVVVVDDDPEVLRLSQEILLAQGAETLIAASGEEALRLFAKRPAAVVLLDVMMPGGLDGFETLARLRALPGGSLAQVVFVTALGDAGTQDQAAKAGADDFLAKPFHQAELVIRVQSLLSAHRTRVELSNCLQVIRAQVEGMVLAEKNRQSAAAMVAHDLRGHLFAIGGGIELTLLSERFEGGGRARLEAAAEGVQLMSRLVDDLLDIERIPTGSMALKSVHLDLVELCQEVCRVMRARFEAKKVSLISSSPDERFGCSCDRALVTRALCNLLDNAVRYAPSGTEVSLGLEREGDEVHITVSDHGPGIPKELHDRVFERHAGFDPVGSERRGSGLGLAFCRMVGRLHGGDVTLDAGEVTRFRVSLPIDR